MPDNIVTIISAVLGGGAFFTFLGILAKGFFDSNKNDADAFSIGAGAAIGGMKEVMGQLREEISRLSEKVDSQEVKINEMKSRNDELRKQYLHALEQLQKSEHEKDKIVVEYEAKKKKMLEEHVGLMADYKAQQVKIETQDREIAELKRNVADLERRLAKYEKQN